MLGETRPTKGPITLWATADLSFLLDGWDQASHLVCRSPKTRISWGCHQPMSPSRHDMRGCQRVSSEQPSLPTCLVRVQHLSQGQWPHSRGSGVTCPAARSCPGELPPLQESAGCLNSVSHLPASQLSTTTFVAHLDSLCDPELPGKRRE